MATRLKEVDAVMVGMGWTGSILARELTKAGITVIGLERGEDLSPRENFALPAVRDELRYTYRLELIQDPELETVTFPALRAGPIPLPPGERVVCGFAQRFANTSLAIWAAVMAAGQPA